MDHLNCPSVSLSEYGVSSSDSTQAQTGKVEFLRRLCYPSNFIQAVDLSLMQNRQWFTLGVASAVASDR